MEFGGGVPAVAGSELVLGHVFLEGGARVDGKSLRLEAAGDGLFFRVSEEARARRLEVRVRGRGRGRIVIGERTFWTEPRWTVHPVEGAFRLRKPYYFPESGGPDVRVCPVRPRRGRDHPRLARRSERAGGRDSDTLASASRASKSPRADVDLSW